MENVLGKQTGYTTNFIVGMWAQIVNIILGLIVMAAPGLWGFPTNAAHNNYITGPLIITFALIAITDVGRNVRWFNILTGSWLAISPFILGYGNPALLINLALGVLIAGFSFIRGRVQQRFGGGWRSLLQNNPQHMQEANRQQ